MPKLLDRVRALMRMRHYSYETEKRYIYWIRHYIGFHNIRNPAEMGALAGALTYFDSRRRFFRTAILTLPGVCTNLHSSLLQIFSEVRQYSNG